MEWKCNENLIPSQGWLQNEIEFVYGKTLKNLEPFSKLVPAPASCHQRYQAWKNIDWTASFWIGILWLCSLYRRDVRIDAVITRQMESFQNRLDQNICLQTHDVGFLYTLSAVAGYQLTGNERARQMALGAAEKLMERYNRPAGILQAWGAVDDPEAQGRMIVDCMMNLSLLYFASEHGGSEKYRHAALTHVEASKRYLIRKDDTTYHTFYMDPITGAPRYGKTHQGFADDSCWARGQAWGIYGFARSYAHTGDVECLKISCRLADYFLAHLPKDQVCYWDLVFTEGKEERDSSAAAILVNGLLETASLLPLSDLRRERYQCKALEILRSLSQEYTTRERPDSNGILLHGVYSKPENNGVDECCIWGDYFYLEALIRLYQSWHSWW